MKSAFETIAIFRQLARHATKITSLRRDRHRKARRFSNIDPGEVFDPFAPVSPPRSVVQPFLPKIHRVSQSRRRQIAFVACCRHHLNQKNRPEWAENLSRLVKRLQDRALNDPHFRYGPVIVRAKHKNGDSYRPITSLLPYDSIIEKCFAGWLSQLLDDVFSPSAVAFRTRRSEPPEHPIQSLVNFRARSGSGILWCAEADIRGFYDTLSHEVARKAFDSQIHRLPDDEQERALVLFDALLAAYSFPAEVLDRGLRELQTENPDGVFPWPEPELRALHGKDPKTLRIGIPQGAAFSGLIANLVLHAADEAVMEVAKGREDDLFYRRYCDDMLLVSKDRTLCHDAFQAYLAKLRELKLPIHEPETTTDFGREFWHMKSKDVYPWGPDPRHHALRVGFIGYQVKFDGTVRIRPSTIKKHQEKLVCEITHLPGFARRHLPRVSKAEIFRSNAWRIVAMSSGRGSSPQQRNWCEAFHVLRDLRFDRLQIEELDQFRNHLIGRLWGVIKRLPEREGIPVESCFHPGCRSLRNFRGYPRSYMAFFESPEMKRNVRPVRHDLEAAYRGGY